MEENSRSLSRMSIGDVIDYSIEIYKKNFKKISLLALYFHVPFMFIYTVVVSYFSKDMIGTTMNFGKVGTTPNPNLPYTIMAFYLVMLVMGLLYLAYSITLKSVMDASVAKIVYSYIVSGNTDDLKSLIKSSFKRFSSLVANRVLSYLIIAGIFFALYILFIILVMIITVGVVFITKFAPSPSKAQSLSAGIIIVSVLIGIVILAVILAIFVFVANLIAKYSMGIQAVIIENKAAAQGISRCNQLSKKNFWHISMTFIFGTMLFFTIPTLLAYGAQSVLFFDKNMFVLAATAVQILTALLNPFITILLTVLFVNLKIKAEGFDLELKVDILLESQKKKEMLLDDGEMLNA